MSTIRPSSGPNTPPGEAVVDFALCHPPRKPRIFVEVKQPGGAGRGVKQALEYAFHTGVPFIALTDGATWSFYLPAEQGSYEERRVFMLEFCSKARRTSRPIPCVGILSGAESFPATRSASLARSTNVGAVARLHGWRFRKRGIGLVDKGDKLLTGLLADAVEARAGFRPEDTDVVNFLASLHQRTSVSTPPPPPPSEEPEKPWKTAAWWAGRIIRSTCTKNPA